MDKIHIINAMFGRKLGGIEQSFVDYCMVLKNLGYKVTALTYPEAPINKKLLELNINIVSVRNLGQHDVFAKSYLKKILKQSSPDAIITHGNRAINLLKFAKNKLNIPLIGVTHNYKLKHIHNVDYVFATTEDLKTKTIEKGFDENYIHIIPNMVKLPSITKKFEEYQDPVVIGAMGRLIDIKGYDYFLKALSLLKHKKFKFKAKLAGDGEDLEKLKQLAKDLDILDDVEFLGWVEDKDKFFNQIDIFCMTSTTEAFGMALVDAFSYGKIVITTNAQGPKQIVTDNHDAIIVIKNNETQISEAIRKVSKDIDLSKKLSQNAMQTASNYSFEKVGKTIDLFFSKSFN